MPLDRPKPRVEWERCVAPAIVGGWGERMVRGLALVIRGAPMRKTRERFRSFLSATIGPYAIFAASWCANDDANWAHGHCRGGAEGA